MEIVIDKNPRVRKDGKKVKPEFIVHSVYESVEDCLRLPNSVKLNPKKEAVFFLLVSILLYNNMLFATKSEYSVMFVVSWVCTLLLPYVLSLLLLKTVAFRTKAVAYALLVCITIWNLFVPFMPEPIMILSFLFCFNAFIVFLDHFGDITAHDRQSFSEDGDDDDFEDDMDWDAYPAPPFSLMRGLTKTKYNLMFYYVDVRKYFLASYYSGDSNDQSIASQHILFALRNKSCAILEFAIYFCTLLVLFFPSEALSPTEWMLFVVSLLCITIVSMITFSLLLLTVDSFAGIITRVIDGDDLYECGAQNFVDYAFKRFINAAPPKADNMDT